MASSLSSSLSPKPSYSMPGGGHLIKKIGHKPTFSPNLLGPRLCRYRPSSEHLQLLHELGTDSSFTAKCPGAVAPRCTANRLLLVGQVVSIMGVTCAYCCGQQLPALSLQMQITDTRTVPRCLDRPDLEALPLSWMTPDFGLRSFAVSYRHA